jgi:hypothetical protein
MAVVMARKLWILIRAFLNSDQLIVTMSFLDMLVEASFCILYLVEFAVNVGIDSNYEAPVWIPIWLHVYRYRALFQAAIVFSYWNVVAFVVRLFYVSGIYVYAL